MSWQSFQFILTTYSPACQKKITVHTCSQTFFCVCSYCMCLFSLPHIAKSPLLPTPSYSRRERKQWSRAEQWLPPWCGGVVYLFEARVCPTCFPSDPPTVTDSATTPRGGLHYSMTSLCQAHLLMAAVLSFITAMAWEMWMIGQRREHIDACTHMQTHHTAINTTPWNSSNGWIISEFSHIHCYSCSVLVGQGKTLFSFVCSFVSLDCAFLQSFVCRRLCAVQRTATQ